VPKTLCDDGFIAAPKGLFGLRWVDLHGAV